MDKVPTIKEIANLLRVSVSTVSRALSNHPRIGAGTKERVKQLAKEMGYEPNTQAIFFKQRKTYVIGVVIPFIQEEFFSQAISGMEAVAIEHQYAILFGQSYDELAREISVVETMKKQRVDGLIISLSKETTGLDHFERFKKNDIPIVYFDRVPAIKEVNKVSCNIYNGTIEMIKWLFDNGCRRIALINGPDKIIASKERLNGYIEGVSSHKIKVDMQLVEKTDLSKEGTIAAMNKLLSLKSKPQVIISFNDYVHMDAVQYARELKIGVNKELYFVSFANLKITGYMAFPPLASIEQYPYRQGGEAMGLLIKILNENRNGKQEYRQVELQTSLAIHGKFLRKR